MLRASVSVVAALVACSPSADVVRVPIAPETRAALLVVEKTEGAEETDGAEAAEEASAYGLFVSAPEDGSTYFTVSAPGGARLWLLEYRCPLAALGFEPGRRELSRDPARGGELPATRRVRSATADGPEPVWAAADASPLAAWRVTGAGPDRGARCRSYRSETLMIETTSLATNPHFAVPLNDSEALIAYSDGRFIRVDTSSRTIDLLALGDLPRDAVYRAPDGELILTDDSGRVARGDLTRGFVAAPSLTSTRSFGRRLAGRRTAASPEEIFSVDRNLDIERFDGSRWTFVERGSGPELRAPASVVWVAPGEIVVVQESAGILRHRNGSSQREMLPPIAAAGEHRAQRASFTARWGVVVGTQFGALYHQQDGQWRVLFAPAESTLSRIIVEIPEGLLIGGQYGAIYEVYPGRAVCAPFQAAPARVDLIERVGRRFVLAGRDAPGLWVTIVEPVEEPGAACEEG